MSLLHTLYSSVQLYMKQPTSRSTIMYYSKRNKFILEMIHILIKKEKYKYCGIFNSNTGKTAVNPQEAQKA